MTFADLFSNDAEPLRNPDQGAGTSVLERPETKESPVRDDGGDADRFAHYVSCLLYTSPSPRDTR